MMCYILLPSLLLVLLAHVLADNVISNDLGSVNKLDGQKGMGNNGVMRSLLAVQQTAPTPTPKPTTEEPTTLPNTPWPTIQGGLSIGALSGIIIGSILAGALLVAIFAVFCIYMFTLHPRPDSGTYANNI